MKIISFTIIAVFLGLSAPGVAFADWQYTTWDMNPEQVVAASSGAAYLHDGKPGDRVFGADLRAMGSYSAAGFGFTSRFFFDANMRLRVVKLTLDDPSRCEELQDQLMGLYGLPDERNGEASIWYDTKNNNRVNVANFTYFSPPDCFVTYGPISGSGGAGL